MNDQQRSVIHENMAKKLHAMCLACTNSIDIIEVFSVTGGLADLLPEELAVLLDQVSGQAVRNMTAHVVDSVKVERVMPTIKPAPEPEDELTTLKRERDEYAAWLDTLSGTQLQKHIDETGVRDHTPEPEYIPEPEVMAEFVAFLDETL